MYRLNKVLKFTWAAEFVKMSLTDMVWMWESYGYKRQFLSSSTISVLSHESRREVCF